MTPNQQQFGITLPPLQLKDILELNIDKKIVDWWIDDNSAGVGTFNEDLYYQFKQRRKIFSDAEVDLIVKWKKFGKFNWSLYEKLKKTRSNEL